MEKDHSPVNGMEVGLITEIGWLVMVATCVGVDMVLGGPALHWAVEIKRIAINRKKIVCLKIGFVISSLLKRYCHFIGRLTLAPDSPADLCMASVSS